MMWMARTGAQWRHLPDEYGKWNNVFRRYRRRVETGVFDAMLETLVEKAGLDEGQRNVVQAMAHQQVVAISCAGFTVDKARFEDEMNIIYYDDKGKMLETDSETLHLRERQVMMGFGMVFGAQLAIAASDEKAFCEHAEVERNAGDAKHLILQPRKSG
jgi:hypothetical protein